MFLYFEKMNSYFFNQFTSSKVKMPLGGGHAVTQNERK